VDLGGGAARVPHRVERQGGASHDVAARKHCGDAGHLVAINDDPAPIVDIEVTEISRVRTGQGVEAQRGNDQIRCQFEFGAGPSQKGAWSGGIRQPEFGADEAQSGHLASVVAQHRAGCSLEHKPRAFLDGVLVFVAAAVLLPLYMLVGGING